MNAQLDTHSPSQELIHAIVELKRRNPGFGYPRIARIISKTFGIEIDRNLVRRVLAKYYHPEDDGKGPSWLTLFYRELDALQADLDAWIESYNHERSHQGKMCCGRTPVQTVGLTQSWPGFALLESRKLLT